MAKKTKRRSISVAPAPYARLQAHCAATGQSLSATVEGWIAAHTAPSSKPSTSSTKPRSHDARTRGKSPDGPDTMRAIIDGRARANFAEQLARKRNPPGSNIVIQPGRDAPSPQSQPQPYSAPKRGTLNPWGQR